MSTEAKISPYEGNPENINHGSGLVSDIAIGAIGLAAGIAIGSVALIAKGLTLDEKQKEALARRKEEERIERARVKKPEQLEIAIVPLKLRAPDTLVKSAISLGFKLQPFELPQVSLQSQPSITLARPSGETLTIRRAETGRLLIETQRRNIATVPEVMKKHTIDQAINHLRKQCRSVEAKMGRNGEYIIVAQEGNQGQKDGAARITAHISKEGVVTVDVSNIKGSRCEKIINDIARAIGGECIRGRKKSEYFQVPVEQKEKIRV